MVQKFGNTKTTLSAVGLGSHEGKYTPNSSVPDLAQRYSIIMNIISPNKSLIYRFILYCSFQSLSVNSASADGMSTPRTPTPMYYPGLSPAISHTYVNQYAGSEYNLDRVQTPQVPYLPFDVHDASCDEFNRLPYPQNAA